MRRLELHACPGSGRDPVLLVLGDPGVGKTSLLAHAARVAAENGVIVLSATGSEFEAQLPYAGLNRLLLPVGEEISRLPPHEASELTAALGTRPRTTGSDRLLAGLALVNLLERLPHPVLLTLDDAHLLDQSSRDLLAFAASRLRAGRVSILAGARGVIPPRGLGPRFPEMRLQPLTATEASELLNRQPLPPVGHARTLVLAQAGGNPMALIEMARAVATAADHGWLNEPLPLTERLTALISDQITSLPLATREALVLVAVAERLERETAARVLPGCAVESLASAEMRGLVKVDRTGVRFLHPLVRSAVYHSSPFGQRATAHRQIAAALAGQPDRQAWHLAAACLQADDDVADMLAATADGAQRRGGAAAAAAAYERAAELTSRPQDQAGRLIAAARIAATTGQANWVQDLATRALALTPDTGHRLLARQAIGWALAWSSRHAAALSALLEVAEEAADRDTPMAWSALATASTVAYQSGEPDAVERIRACLGRLENCARQADAASSGPDAAAARLWILAATRSGGDARPDARIPDLAQLPAPGEASLSMAGAAAWLLDRSEAAVCMLQSAIQMLRAPELRGTSGASLSALGWACLDAGQWEEALSAAAEADDLGIAYQMAVVSASSNLIKGTILAARGARAEAQRCIGRALECDPEQCRSVTARARHALGLAALADDDYIVAFGRLRPLFGEDAQPLHFHVSYLAVADLAIASARSGRASEGRDLLDRIERAVGNSASARLGQLQHWARGVLADTADPEPHFAKALADPAGLEWPFERARMSLDYGAWLRRQRRINDAKTILAPAVETLRRLQAAPWLKKAETELRACGVSIAAPVPGAIAMLTPQQQQIVQLAARGHSNREIGQRLFLSPRTVSSHLYRCFPKLGVSSRNQLREVLSQAEPDRAVAATDPA